MGRMELKLPFVCTGLLSVYKVCQAHRCPAGCFGNGCNLEKKHLLECDCSVTDKPASAHTPRRFKRKHVALVPFCLACLQRGIVRLLGCEVSHQKLCAAVLDPLCSVVLVR